MIIELTLLLALKTNELTNLQLNSNPSNVTRSFLVGDSLQQKDEQRIAEEKAKRVDKLASLYRRSQREYAGGVEVIGDYPVKNGCVPYAWSQGMQTRGYHYAKYYPTTQTPQKFAITYEGYWGHAVVVEQDLGDKLLVRDANYIPYKITRRIISKSLVKGYLI